MPPPNKSFHLSALQTTQDVCGDQRPVHQRRAPRPRTRRTRQIDKATNLLENGTGDRTRLGAPILYIAPAGIRHRRRRSSSCGSRGLDGYLGMLHIFTVWLHASRCATFNTAQRARHRTNPRDSVGIGCHRPPSRYHTGRMTTPRRRKTLCVRRNAEVSGPSVLRRCEAMVLQRHYTNWCCLLCCLL